MASKPHPPGPRSKIVGANIRAARVRAGLSQVELAERLGWTQGTILNLENARTNMRVSQLVDLAWSLRVSPATLLGGTEDVDESGHARESA